MSPVPGSGCRPSPPGAAQEPLPPRWPLRVGSDTRGRAAGTLRGCSPCGKRRGACQVAGREARLPAGLSHHPGLRIPAPAAAGPVPSGRCLTPPPFGPPGFSPRESPAALRVAEPGPDRGGGISPRAAPGLGGSRDAEKVRLQHSLGEKRKDLGLRANAWGSAREPFSRFFCTYQIYSTFGRNICLQRLLSSRSNARFHTTLTGCQIILTNFVGIKKEQQQKPPTLQLQSSTKSGLCSRCETFLLPLCLL